MFNVFDTGIFFLLKWLTIPKYTQIIVNITFRNNKDVLKEILDIFLTSIVFVLLFEENNNFRNIIWTNCLLNMIKNIVKPNVPWYMVYAASYHIYQK